MKNNQTRFLLRAFARRFTHVMLYLTVCRFLNFVPPSSFSFLSPSPEGGREEGIRLSPPFPHGSLNLISVPFPSPPSSSFLFAPSHPFSAKGDSPSLQDGSYHLSVIFSLVAFKDLKVENWGIQNFELGDFRPLSVLSRRKENFPLPPFSSPCPSFFFFFLFGKLIFSFVLCGKG